jgi:hypothetical protein
MAQGILPFKYELERSEAGMTALAGLPLYLDLAKVVGLSRSIQRHLRVRDKGQGWTDGQVVMALIMLNLAGREHVEDLRGVRRGREEERKRGREEERKRRGTW